MLMLQLTSGTGGSWNNFILKLTILKMNLNFVYIIFQWHLLIYVCSRSDTFAGIDDNIRFTRIIISMSNAMVFINMHSTEIDLY